jgi:prepilin-type N-terminal cleavage/methylation domain-containing protein/prepilin-type processing-associated H-X9-DG protein
MGRKRCQGFTLIEMLVVIAIIAVLAAILFPVFSRVRENGRRVVCAANLQQIGTAITMYEQDYGGFLPTWCLAPYSASSPNPAASPAGTWDVSISSYLRSTQVLSCPSNPYGRDPTTQKPFRAYAMAQYTQVVIGTGATAVVMGCYKDQIPAPVQTVLLFEKGQQLPGIWADALGQNVFQSHNDDFKANVKDGQPFHFQGKNILYVDGHVKFATTGQYPFTYDSGRTAGVAGDIWTSSFANWQGPGICAVAARSDKGGDWPLPQ